MIELTIIIKFAKKKLCPSKNKKPFSIAFNICDLRNFSVKKSWVERWAEARTLKSLLHSPTTERRRAQRGRGFT